MSLRICSEGITDKGTPSIAMLLFHEFQTKAFIVVWQQPSIPKTLGLHCSLLVKSWFSAYRHRLQGSSFEEGSSGFLDCWGHLSQPVRPLGGVTPKLTVKTRPSKKQKVCPAMNIPGLLFWPKLNGNTPETEQQTARPIIITLNH